VDKFEVQNFFFNMLLILRSYGSRNVCVYYPCICA